VTGDCSVRQGSQARRSPLRARLAPLAVLLFAAQLAAPARGARFDDDGGRRRSEGQ
jgi:hypothetical protein